MVSITDVNQSDYLYPDKDDQRRSDESLNRPNAYMRILGNEKVRQLVQTNRENFDRTAAEPLIKFLEAKLAATQAQVRAFETSTIWRMTRPIRAAADFAKSWHRAIGNKQARSAHRSKMQQQYDRWIALEESPCRAAIMRPKLALYPKTLCLVLWVGADRRSVLTPLLADCPSTCTVLILDQNGVLPSDVTTHRQVLRVPVPSDCNPWDGIQIALKLLDADMLCFLDGRDQVAPGALALMANVAAQFPSVDLLFADEDWLDAQGSRVYPFFKPDWDPELQRGRDLIGPFAFYRADLVRQAEPVMGPAWVYDLASQVAAAAHPNHIHHVPAVLCHRTTVPVGHAEAMQVAVMAQLRRAGVAALIEPHPKQRGWHRIIYALPQPVPLVSIIVPTRDRPELLRACVDGVLNHTHYSNLELLIVDNGSTHPKALTLLDGLVTDKRVQVLRQSGPFNWSALNNTAAASAQGSILLFLNNDITVLNPEWLTVLVSHAIQPGIGAVGAKLLYPDRRVQHAGLTTDQSGMPQHLFRYFADGTPGIFGLMGLARQVWGVTGACLAIPRQVLTAVGGLNEDFPITFNDVELCLRLTAHGYRILWTPWAKLEHREMGTRPSDNTNERREKMWEELEQLIRDWGQLIQRDPFINPNLHTIGEELHFRAAR